LSKNRGHIFAPSPPLYKPLTVPGVELDGWDRRRIARITIAHKYETGGNAIRS
jgi:hypothetical protein